MPWVDLVRAVLVTAVLALPLAVSIWALLDAARRPQWAWSLAERNQVMWLAAILAGVLLVCAGVLVSGWYLWKVRPVVAAAERGEMPPR